MSDAGVIKGEDCRGIINPLDSIKKPSMYLRRVNNGIEFLWSDINGALNSVAIIYNCYGDSMRDAAVANGF